MRALTHVVAGAGIGFLLGTTWLARPVPASAQETAVRDSLLDRMTGTWVLRGTIEGRPTTWTRPGPAGPLHD